MNRSRIIRLMIAAAFLIFACAPVLSPSLAPTLDPASVNTAIAQTAGAAAAATSAAQGLPPGIGPTLEGGSLNTLIAQTAGAAASQTAAFIPPTLTPSVTPFPTWTASVVPSATPTFIFILPTSTRTPRPAATATQSGGGGSGGGGGGPGGKANYECQFISVSPRIGAVMAPRKAFTTVWTVKNTGPDWLENSTDLIFVSGTKLRARSVYDFDTTVSTGKRVALPEVSMRAPSAAGTYTAFWALHIGHQTFCSLPLKIVVR